MPLVMCPHCQQVFYSEEHVVIPVSPAALAILMRAPSHFKRGHTVSMRQLAELTGFSYRQIRNALMELKRLGYTQTRPYGKRGRQQYLGVHSRFTSSEILRLIQAA